LKRFHGLFSPRELSNYLRFILRHDQLVDALRLLYNNIGKKCNLPKSPPYIHYSESSRSTSQFPFAPRLEFTEKKLLPNLELVKNETSSVNTSSIPLTTQKFSLDLINFKLGRETGRPGRCLVPSSFSLAYSKIII